MQSAGFWKQSWNTFKRICALPLIALVKFYQLCISPFTPPSCPFNGPYLRSASRAYCEQVGVKRHDGGVNGEMQSCSQYALEALRKYGPLKGLWLTLRRLARCHPWGGSGYDPVP